MATLVERLRAKSDRFWAVRERIGFKQKVYILTRVWPGPRLGEGVPTDTVVRVKPAPGIRDLAHSRQMSVHGQTVEGDLAITGIAFNNYSEEQLGNVQEGQPLRERFYLIDGKTYSVSSISQKFVSWEIILKKSNKNLWNASLLPQD